MDKAFRLSDTGRAALEAGNGPSVLAELIMEIMQRAGDVGITQANCVEVCQQLCEQYGSTELALGALRRGDVDLEREETWGK